MRIRGAAVTRKQASTLIALGFAIFFRLAAGPADGSYETAGLVIFDVLSLLALGLAIAAGVASLGDKP
jgi:hypothetical protein